MVQLLKEDTAVKAVYWQLGMERFAACARTAVQLKSDNASAILFMNNTENV